MGWGRRKDGRPYKKRPENGIRREDLQDSSDSGIRVPIDYDKYRLRKVEEIKKEKKSSFETTPINLGVAKGLLISAVPIIISADPTMTLSTIYGAWQFGKFSYGVVTDVQEEYKKTRDLKRALSNVIQRVTKQTIPMLQEFSIKSISEGSAKIIWTSYKKANPTIAISNEWDKYIENAMARTFEGILNKVV